jgi:hypothetical protein
VRFKIASILGLAVLLRAPGLFTDFWLDEIWALENVAAIDSASGVFTRIHHDSNHWLVSLWMYALGSDRAFWLYRLPSFLAGVAAVVVCGWLGRMGGGSGSRAALFAAASFPLGFYASEARGYSLAVLAGLLAFLCLLRAIESRDGRWLAAYGLFAALGILSHLSVLIVLTAAIFYSLVMTGRGRIPLARVLAGNALPIGVLGLLVVFDLRYLTIGGGPRTPPGTLLLQTASLSIGGPVEGSFVWTFGALAAVLVGIELGRTFRRFWRERETTDPRRLAWIFYVVVLGLPLWLTLVLDPPFLFPRYFLVSLAFVPVLLGSLTTSLGRRGAFALACFYLGANAVSWSDFTLDGRGRYERALRDLLEISDGVIRVGSDQDFRARMTIEFYRQRLGGDAARIRYGRTEEARFLLAERPLADSDDWVWVRTYRASPLSGTRWHLYRRASGRPFGASGAPLSLALPERGLAVPVGGLVRNSGRRGGDVSVLSALDDLDVARRDELLQLLVLGGLVTNLPGL